jgi:hypothetical protein
MKDVPEFIRKAHEIYGYQHFINDAGRFRRMISCAGFSRTFSGPGCPAMKRWPGSTDIR